MKPTTAQQQITNLEAIIAAIEVLPKLRLNAFASEHPCGTLYCVAGLLPFVPHFATMGVFASGNDAPNMVDNFGNPASMDQTLKHLFGDFGDVDEAGIRYYSTYDHLCTSYLAGRWDHELLEVYTPLPDDKTLALLRLNKALTIRKQELENSNDHA